MNIKCDLKLQKSCLLAEVVHVLPCTTVERRSAWCFGVIAEAVDSHCRELKVISRGLDLCESTLCSDVAEVRTWVMGALEEQQRMMLNMMGETGSGGYEGSSEGCWEEFTARSASYHLAVEGRVRLRICEVERG